MNNKVYKYGIDITNATLQTKAYELGIQKAVSEMSQSEKQQLRIIQILEASKVAWGDLANTVSSPSNQIRILKTNLKETGMVLGQLFIPLLEKVLPMLNALTLVVKDLLISFANFAGIKINFEAFGEGFVADEDMLEMEESLDGAVDSLEDLKNQIMGFDEVNPLDSIKDSFDGISNGIDLTAEILAKTEEYEDAWNRAYGNMQDTATEFANVIKGKFSGIGSAISNLGVALKGLDGLEFLGEGFAEGFTDVMDFLINDVGATAINGFANALDFLGIGLDNLDDEQIKDIGKAIGEITAAILVYKTGSVALTAGQNLLNLLTQYKTLGVVAVGISVAITGFEIGKKINEWITGEDAGDFSIWDFFGDVGWAIKNGTFVDDLSYALGDVWRSFSDKIGSIFKNIGSTISDSLEYEIGRAKTILSKLPTWIASTFKSEIGSRIKTAIDFGTAIEESFNAGLEAVKEAWNNFARWLNEKLTWKINPIKVMGKTVFDGVTIDLGKIPTFQTGGFVEDGLFMANRNELVGKFSNGKTAVANGIQIIEGIEGGVERAVVKVLAPYLADIAESSRITANKNFGISSKSIFDATRREANNYTMQTGRNAFLI